MTEGFNFAIQIEQTKLHFICKVNGDLVPTINLGVTLLISLLIFYSMLCCFYLIWKCVVYLKKIRVQGRAVGDRGTNSSGYSLDEDRMNFQNIENIA